MMAEQEMSPAIRIDELAALDATARGELAITLRQLPDTFDEVRDGKTASHTLGVLAHLLDPT